MNAIRLDRAYTGRHKSRSRFDGKATYGNLTSTTSVMLVERRPWTSSPLTALAGIHKEVNPASLTSVLDHVVVMPYNDLPNCERLHRERAQGRSLPA